MLRGFGLATVLGLLGCGDNLGPGSTDLIDELVVTPFVDSPAALAVTATAITAFDERSVAVVRATKAGQHLCPTCEGSECNAGCLTYSIDVGFYTPKGILDQIPHRVATIYPDSYDVEIASVKAVALDQNRVGIAWLECNTTSCEPGRSAQSCTARYTTFMRDPWGVTEVGKIVTLYENWVGDLRLAFERRTRHLMAVVGTREPSSAGLRAAEYTATAEEAAKDWAWYGGQSARAPAVTASESGFTIIADDPDPSATDAERPPCSSMCDCHETLAPKVASGGLFAYIPKLADAPVRIAAGRGTDGGYVSRDTTAVVDVAGRVIIATMQPDERNAELFEPAEGAPVWTRRVATQSSRPVWLGVLGDRDHLAWLGSESADDPADGQRLVAGVIVGKQEERGELSPAVPSEIIDAAPVVLPDGVRKTYLLRKRLDTSQFELLEVRADW